MFNKKVLIIIPLSLTFLLYQNFTTVLYDRTEAILTIDTTKADAASENIQVNYRRGFLANLDKEGTLMQVLGVKDGRGSKVLAGSNLIGQAFDLNIELNSSLFILARNNLHADRLVPNSDNNFLRDPLQTIRAREPSTTKLASVVQISGTPYAAPEAWLNLNYDDPISHSGNEYGNVYHLPNNGPSQMKIQNAIASYVIAHESANEPLSGNIWVGTQEPSHTLGFSELDTLTLLDGTQTNCLVLATVVEDNEIRREGKLRCKQINIRRYINYWTPIAIKIKQHNANIKLGALQLNSKDRSIFSWAAEEIIKKQVPIDYFTVQRYASPADYMTRLEEAYNVFKKDKSGKYAHVKMLFNRYGFGEMDDGPESRTNAFATADGMIKFLTDEREIMQKAYMMYGYVYATSGVTTEGTFLPQVIKWLQNAPTPMRPVVSQSKGSIDSFALVARGVTPSAYVAIWNNSLDTKKTKTTVKLGTLFANKAVKVLRFTNSTPLEVIATTTTTGDISIANLDPRTLALISID